MGFNPNSSVGVRGRAHYYPPPQPSPPRYTAHANKGAPNGVFKTETKEKKRGRGDVISVLYLSWDLGGGGGERGSVGEEGGGGVVVSSGADPGGPRSEPVALPGSLFKEITQSSHLCCIMGQRERPVHCGRPSQTSQPDIPPPRP